MIAVGTFGFQARPFYEKQDCTLCGTNEDWPKGHAFYCLVKRLDREDVAADGSDPLFEIVRGTEEDGEFIEKQLHAYNVAQLQIPDEGEPLCKNLWIAAESSSPFLSRASIHCRPDMSTCSG